MTLGDSSTRRSCSSSNSTTRGDSGASELIGALENPDALPHDQQRNPCTRFHKVLVRSDLPEIIAGDEADDNTGVNGAHVSRPGGSLPQHPCRQSIETGAGGLSPNTARWMSMELYFPSLRTTISSPTISHSITAPGTSPSLRRNSAGTEVWPCWVMRDVASFMPSSNQAMIEPGQRREAARGVIEIEGDGPGSGSDLAADGAR